LTLGVLAGCGGNPFIDESVVEPGDPNISADNRFLWDPKNKLTMNNVEYDSENDQLIINNLPFDGPDGRYDNTLTLVDEDATDSVNAPRVYESRFDQALCGFRRFHLPAGHGRCGCGLAGLWQRGREHAAHSARFARKLGISLRRHLYRDPVIQLPRGAGTGTRRSSAFA
jgi:hypothetical protein